MLNSHFYWKRRTESTCKRRHFYSYALWLERPLRVTAELKMCLYMDNNYIIVNRRSFSLSQRRAGSRKFEKVNKFLFQQICEQKFQKMDQSGSKHMPNRTNITEAVHPDWLQSSRFTKEVMSFDFKQVQLCLTSSESRKTDWVCPLFFSKVQNNKRLVYNMRGNA